jgi:ribulose bisphosphate carboxylase small subunit
MNEEEAGQVMQKTLETRKPTLSEQALEKLRELLDAGFDSIQEYGEFRRTKMESNRLDKL